MAPQLLKRLQQTPDDLKAMTDEQLKAEINRLHAETPVDIERLSAAINVYSPWLVYGPTKPTERDGYVYQHGLVDFTAKAYPGGHLVIQYYGWQRVAQAVMSEIG